MAKSAVGEGSAHDASVKTESNVERLERELIEERKKAERQALVDNISNAKDKAKFHQDQAKAAEGATTDAEKELADFDVAAEKAAAEEAAYEAAAKEEEE